VQTDRHTSTIVIVALVAGIAVAGSAISARTSSDDSTTPDGKSSQAGKPGSRLHVQRFGRPLGVRAMWTRRTIEQRRMDPGSGRLSQRWRCDFLRAFVAEPADLPCG